MNFAATLRKSRPLKGTLITTSSCEIAEAISYTGLDWVFIDLEHAALDSLDAQDLVRALSGRVASVIRLPDQSPTQIKKALDTGCDGIIVPMINTHEEAKAAVRAAKYAPQGQRSVGISRAHKYGLGFKDYMNGANKNTAVIALIENIKAVKNIDSILSVPGIDAVFIGPYDLSASMGALGQLDKPAVQEAVDSIFARAKKAKKPIGMFTPTLEMAKIAIDKGATLLAIGTDILLLADSIKKIVGLRGRP